MQPAIFKAHNFIISKVQTIILQGKFKIFAKHDYQPVKQHLYLVRFEEERRVEWNRHNIIEQENSSNKKQIQPKHMLAVVVDSANSPLDQGGFLALQPRYPEAPQGRFLLG